jgi:hypothetical protein
VTTARAIVAKNVVFIFFSPRGPLRPAYNYLAGGTVLLAATGLAAVVEEAGLATDEVLVLFLVFVLFDLLVVLVWVAVLAAAGAEDPAGEAVLGA